MRYYVCMAHKEHGNGAALPRGSVLEIHNVSTGVLSMAHTHIDHATRLRADRESVAYGSLNAWLLNTGTERGSVDARAVVAALARLQSHTRATIFEMVEAEAREIGMAE